MSSGEARGTRETRGMRGGWMTERPIEGSKPAASKANESRYLVQVCKGARIGTGGKFLGLPCKAMN